MENVIQNLRNELIRSISAIDAWFDMDRTLLEQPINTNETVAEVLYKLTLSSRNLLDSISQKSQRNLGGPVDLQFPHDTLGEEWKEDFDRVNLSIARAELREQLDRCLIYLELLQHQQIKMKRDTLGNEVEKFDGFQGIYLLLIHLKRYQGDLNQLAERNQGRHQQR